MKTTIDISDPLFIAVKRKAQQGGSTFKEVVESSLQAFLKRESVRRPPFKLRKSPFVGKGISKEFPEWSSIRKELYEGRGG